VRDSRRTAAGFRSTFAPPAAKPRGTGRNGRGHRVTAEAADRPFVLVTGDDRGQVGTGRDSRGTGSPTCKIAGNAFTGSNPVPATPPLSCRNTATPGPLTPPARAGIRSNFAPPDAVPTPTVPPAPLGRTRPRSARPPRVRSAGAGGGRRAGEHAAVGMAQEGWQLLMVVKIRTTLDDSFLGPTHNPWDLERTAGASSTGAGAVLAAREIPLAVGTDTGGSIRVPAAFCGVTGLKPTFGLVPCSGVMPQSWTLDHVGPMGRSVEDVALMLTAIAGYEVTDPESIRAPLCDYSEGLDQGVVGLRVGIPGDWFFDVIDPEVQEATHRAASLLVEQGAELVHVDLPHAHLSDAVGAVIIYTEFAALHEANLDRLEDFGGSVDSAGAGGLVLRECGRLSPGPSSASPHPTGSGEGLRQGGRPPRAGNGRCGAAARRPCLLCRGLDPRMGRRRGTDDADLQPCRSTRPRTSGGLQRRRTSSGHPGCLKALRRIHLPQAWLCTSAVHFLPPCDSADHLGLRRSGHW
jgi:hypothetical protein